MNNCVQIGKDLKMDSFDQGRSYMNFVEYWHCPYARMVAWGRGSEFKSMYLRLLYQNVVMAFTIS